MLPFVILGAINTYIFLNTGNKKVQEQIKEPIQEKKGTGAWTVYGTTWCGWTTKQLEFLKKKGIEHKFVDCEKSKCDGIDAFPVMESPSGERFTGYKEI
jgi:hypothetical protein|tara:strand:+ start:176 stop:472 length:297 start_codon:yes stop_codon:yes gene_type:complete